MCEICRSSSCDARCPNADDPEIMGICANCGEELRADYTYFKDDECNVFCGQECAAKYHGIRETEWDDE